MNPSEYVNLERVERDHWFYQGKRAIVRHWLDRTLRLGADDLLVDAGCGAGAFLAEMSGTCRVVGLDSSALSMEIAAARLGPAGGRLIQTDLDQVAMEDGCAAAVTLLDVLEHLDDDAAALREMIRLVRPGGV